MMPRWIAPRRGLAAGLGLVLTAQADLMAQSVAPDTGWRVPPAVGAMAVPAVRRRVGFDHGHRNFHRLDGSFGAFGRLLTAAQIGVRPVSGPFTPARLDSFDLVVIAGLRTAEDVPTDGELGFLQQWVEAGGAVMILADHTPFALPAGRVAALFGAVIRDGFALDSSTADPPPFTRREGSLRSHPVTAGLEAVVTFTGTSLELGKEWTSLLSFPPATFQFVPLRPWQFDSTTVRFPISGASQAAVRRFGRGRIAVLGESAFLTAQLLTGDGKPELIGFGADGASDDWRFALQLVQWLLGHG